MAQGFAGLSILSNDVGFKDSANLDAFSRLRVSNPATLFDAQQTYNLNPLLFESITSGSGASVAHDATNGAALFTFSSTPTTGKAYQQSYEYIRYQPSKSQLAFVTFNFIESVTDVLKFAGYSDGSNGFEFQNDGTNNQFKIYSTSSNGDQTVTQSNWNLDKLDGTGSSGITLDITKTQILIIDFQALYAGRVRMGFDINGVIIYCHEFLHANIVSTPYIYTANLPVRCGMTCTATVSTTMRFICCAVVSEGGMDETIGYEFAQEGTATAASGARTHVLSIRPKLLFNGLTNRTKMAFIEVNALVTGNNPIYWELVLGQAISGTTTFNDVNSTYSGMEYNTAGTISGSPAIVVDSGYVAASNQSKGAEGRVLTSRYPITLDAAGAVRALGTISIIATGIGASSAMRVAGKFKEIR